MASIRLLLRRLGAIAWTAFAILAISLGVIVGLGRALLPFAGHLEPRLEAWLTEEFQRPVEVDGLGASWALTGPEFRLTDVSIINPDTGAAGLNLPQAQVRVNLLAWLLPGESLLGFRIADTRLSLERDSQGRLRVQGLTTGTSRGEGQALEWLLRQGRISLVDAEVGYTEAARGLSLRFHDVDVTLDNQGDIHRITGSARVSQPGGGRLEWHIELQEGGTGLRFRDARFFVQGEQVDLQAWLQGSELFGVKVEQGRADFRFWGRVSAARLQQVTGAFRITDLRLQEPRKSNRPPSSYALQRLGARLLWRRSPGGWRLSGENLELVRAGHRWPDSGFTLDYQAGRWRFGADYLRVEDLAPLAQLGSVLPAAWHDKLQALAPEGTVRELAASWLPARPLGRGLSLRGRLQGIGWHSVGEWPGLAGVTGRLQVAPGHGRLVLDTPRIALAYPALFRQVLRLERVQGKVRWQQTGSNWTLQAPRISGRTQSARVLGRLKLVFQADGSRPFIDLRGQVMGGRVVEAKQFWPVGIMPDEVVAWLDQALVAGHLARARALVYGDLDRWPFDGASGRFEVRGAIDDATLDYRSGWPRVTQADARLLFEGRSMDIVADTGAVSGARVDRVTARIADLENALLRLDVQARGEAGALLRFLRESPLNRKYGTHLKGLSATGRGRVSTRIELPLEDDSQTEQVNGRVWLDEVEITDEKWGVTFSRLVGTIRFDQDGFFSEAISARFRGQPVKLEIAVGAHAPEDTLAQVQVTGAFSAADLLGSYTGLGPLSAAIEGVSQWRLGFTVPAASAPIAAATTAVLHLESDLRGTRVALPAPLQKAPATALPFALELPMPYEGGLLRFHYGGRLAGAIQPAAPGGLRGQLRFGARRAALPERPGLIVTGTAEHLDLDAWFGLATSVTTAGGDSALRRIDVEVDELRALGRVFHSMRIDAAPVAGSWRVSLAGQGVDGELRLPSDDSQGLVGDFETLVLPPAQEKTGELYLDPRRLPALHLVVDEFTFGNAPLGRMRLEAYPTADGLRIDLLRTENANTGVEADGTWSVDAGGGQHSVFDLTITAESLGTMLANFGYAGLVEGGPTLARLSVHWPGAPSRFALERLGGEMQVGVGAGRLVPVEPGAGRIFGLLSLQALPRRLMLDFTDLFGEGLSFDTIVGSFHFEAGVATTDDLLLKGPAARIEVDGQVNLDRRTYDQIVSVYPSVGTTLPLVGALAAGPPGAAALFLLQNIFKEQIQSMASYRYSVTGPWSDPVVELIETPPEDVTPPLKPPVPSP